MTGVQTCALPICVESNATTLDEIIDETLSAVSSERTTRVIDNEAAGSMERRKREGYF